MSLCITDRTSKPFGKREVVGCVLQLLDYPFLRRKSITG
jgi:hypothetical protein